MRCWWCGVEPDDVETYDVVTGGSPQPVRTIEHGRWPGGDHTHAATPPTADELADQAYAMLTQRAF